jgi:hypothetical protein
MKLFTMGFTKKSAEEFFTMLQRSGAKRLVGCSLEQFVATGRLQVAEVCE